MARVFKNDEGKYQHVLMHRIILNAPDGVLVDHRSHDGLDNRDGNIRLADASQNNFNRRIARNNTSGCPGVYQDRDIWRARIWFRNGVKNLGSFPSFTAAAKARRAAEAELYGDFRFVIEAAE